MKSPSRLALIVGSGFVRAGLPLEDTWAQDTPFGMPSSPLFTTTLCGVTVLGLARHGFDHMHAPHEVNYRANLWALREAGATACIAVNVVGGIDPRMGPGSLCVPEQLIDYTWGRESSFGRSDGGVRHIDFTEPFDPALRQALLAAITAEKWPAHAGVYGVTQGPRLETRAEVDRLERDGCHIVGMTALPEAALARELDIRYAILAGSVNFAAGRSDASGGLLDEIEASLGLVMQRCARVLHRVVGAWPEAEV